MNLEPGQLWRCRGGGIWRILRRNVHGNWVAVSKTTPNSVVHWEYLNDGRTTGTRDVHCPGHPRNTGADWAEEAIGVESALPIVTTELTPVRRNVMDFDFTPLELALIAIVAILALAAALSPAMA